MLKLYIGNKNYSSWSMRPWVLLREAGIAFEEVNVRFDSFEPTSNFKRVISQITPTGKVPALLDGDLAIWDTLAIAEYLAEQFPEKQLWPVSVASRAQARSVCAEMHAGFTSLRSACGMNIEADLSHQGALIWRDQAAVRQDVARIDQIWSSLIAAHGGPMLFGRFSIADAYFAPVVMRIRSYALPVSPMAQAYVQRVTELRSVSAWMAQAMAEQDFLAFEEPYRLKR